MVLEVEVKCFNSLGSLVIFKIVLILPKFDSTWAFEVSEIPKKIP